MNVVRDWLLVEFDQEMALTRRVLERVPRESLDWAPHEKSAGLGELAEHLARIPHWGAAILAHDGYDLGTSSAGRRPAGSSLDDVIAMFDRHVADVRQDLLRRTDAELEAPWTLRDGTRTVLSLPRFAALRMFLVSHTIHHRGQMTVYLRMRNVPLPPLYGPSADERM